MVRYLTIKLNTFQSSGQQLFIGTVKKRGIGGRAAAQLDVVRNEGMLQLESGGGGHIPGQ